MYSDQVEGLQEEQFFLTQSLFLIIQNFKGAKRATKPQMKLYGYPFA